jgi:hypothetical protein
MEGLLTLRRAPGNCHFNFVQDLNLSDQLPYNVVVNDSNIHQSSVLDGQAYYSMPPPTITMRMGDSGYDDPSRGRPIVKSSLPHGSDGTNEERLSSFSDVYPSIIASDVGSNKYAVLRRNSLSVSLPHGDIVLEDEEYESPVMPQGFVFQLLILSTWGDPYYVGLNGIELYDQNGDKIRLTENSEYETLIIHSMNNTSDIPCIGQKCSKCCLVTCTSGFYE